MPTSIDYGLVRAQIAADSMQGDRGSGAALCPICKTGTMQWTVRKKPLKPGATVNVDLHVTAKCNTYACVDMSD